MQRGGRDKRESGGGGVRRRRGGGDCGYDCLSLVYRLRCKRGHTQDRGERRAPHAASASARLLGAAVRDAPVAHHCYRRARLQWDRRGTTTWHSVGCTQPAPFWRVLRAALAAF